ncbi:MAG: HmuY family protein, partial [Dehalococcoidia bacterium]
MLALSLGTLLVIAVLLIGGWMAWAALRPGPEGFPLSSGEAAGVPGEVTDALQYTIDARSRQEWAYFDFSSGTSVSTTQDTLDWDLAFRRNDLITNGGETNPVGAGGAVDLGDVSLEEAVVPADGYLSDVIDESEGIENPALDKWYKYSWATHVISSRNHTYAVRTATGESALL